MKTTHSNVNARHNGASSKYNNASNPQPQPVLKQIGTEPFIQPNVTSSYMPPNEYAKSS